MDAGPELRALLHQRRQRIEGPNNGTRINGVGGRSGVSPSAPHVRMAPQQMQPMLSSANAGLGPIPRSSVTGPSPFQANGISSRSYEDDPRTTFNLERRVNMLSMQNDQLVQEIDCMKNKLENEGGIQFSEERDRLLAETDELLAETDRMTAASQQMMQQRMELQAEANAVQASVKELVEFRSECEAMRLRNKEEDQAEALARRNTHHEGLEYIQRVEQMTMESKNLRRQNELLIAEVNALRRASVEGEILKEEIRSVRAENEEMRQANIRLEHARLEHERCIADSMHAAQATPSGGSESRLRTLMTSQGTTPAQLKEAIGAADALLAEARRELAKKKLREKRAAFEQLHDAIEKNDETYLEQSIEAAQNAEVDEEDIEKGQAKLTQLRSLTSEERALRAIRELESRRKKDAFQLVKKDDIKALQALLDGLEEELPNSRWLDWKDYAGRTMLQYAREARAVQTQKLLARLGSQQSGTQNLVLQGPPSPVNREGLPPSPVNRKLSAPEDRLAASSSHAEPTPDFYMNSIGVTTELAVAGIHGADAGAGAEAGPPQNEALEPASSEPEEVVPEPTLSAQEEATLKSQALRAVVQDDCVTLAQVLESTPKSLWSKWQNKAGKDLLTLSEERGSNGAYSLLAKELGIVLEMARESFEERESVWVFLQGEVQPRRATVMEETPKEAESILVEYWDGDDPADYVERCLVRKMWS